ncbi:MAG TPA: DUF4870 domain-containing protein [archaeon]|nr:DUF4870 domain-containing protein [archaeon]
MANTTKSGSSGSGLSQNVAGALCYLLGFITGILFLLIEKDNKFVKFHAMQAILFSVAFFVASVILSMFWVIPFLGWLIAGIGSTLLGIAGLLLWLFLMWKAYQGEKFKLPVIGDIAEKNS